MKPNITKWKADPVAFIHDVLVNPETGKAFELFPIQERFLRELFSLTPDGRLKYPEAIYGCPKKSGKTTTAAMAMLYAVVVLGGRFAEGIVLANDEAQATDRIFTAIARIVEASPMLRDSAKITAGRIEFRSTGSTIAAISSDFASAAGSNRPGNWGARHCSLMHALAELHSGTRRAYNFIRNGYKIWSMSRIFMTDNAFVRTSARIQ